MNLEDLLSQNNVRTGYFKSIDGSLLRYLVIGEGFPLLMCNGLGCTITFWKYLIRDLGRKYKLILWDYPGHGLSNLPSDWRTLSIESLAKLVNKLMDYLEVDKAVLLGHSMGVQVIFETAHQFPERVKALIPVCGAYGRPIDQFLHTSLLKYTIPINFFSSIFLSNLYKKIWYNVFTSSFARYIGNFIGVNPRLVNPEDIDAYLYHLSNIDTRVFNIMAYFMQNHTAENYLNQIQQPTLIVAGTNDHFTPFWVSLKMFELLPNAKLLSVPQGSHVAHIEMPRFVNKNIDLFVESIIK